mmetsp:Transcript_130978/g.407336  ORF Transcript_130978/g.407336 Transcript_130978/m.407336 type:complete len:240 (-) Transcript_130978:303-1022(-)
MAACASRDTLARDFCRDWRRSLHLSSICGSFFFSCVTVRFASAKGALTAAFLPSVSSLLSTTSWRPRVTEASAARTAASALSRPSSGSSRLRPSAVENASANGTAVSSSACRVSSSSFTSATRASAAALSANSCRLCLSSATPFSSFRWASCTFFFRAECADCALLARTLIFISSVLTSPRAPMPCSAPISSDFCLRKAMVWFTDSRVSCRPASTAFTHSAYLDHGSKYTVPWLPESVT